MPGFFDQDDHDEDESFPYWEQDDIDLAFGRPPSWFDSEREGVVTNCLGCDYYFAIQDGLCQFCDFRMTEGVAEVLAGFESLLTKHTAFAVWSAENEPRAA